MSKRLRRSNGCFEPIRRGRREIWPNPSRTMQFGLENGGFKSLQSKLSFVEIDHGNDSVKDKQKNLDQFTHMETNSKFVDERMNQLQSSLKKSKKEVDECHQQILCWEAYSRRKNIKFEGIAEDFQNNATSTRSDNTEDDLVDFLENVPRIEDAKNIEFQRIHRLGKRKNDSGGWHVVSNGWVIAPPKLVPNFWPCVTFDRYWCKPKETLSLVNVQSRSHWTSPGLVVTLRFFSSIMKYVQRYASFLSSFRVIFFIQ